MDQFFLDIDLNLNNNYVIIISITKQPHRIELNNWQFIKKFSNNKPLLNEHLIMVLDEIKSTQNGLIQRFQLFFFFFLVKKV